MASEDLNVPHNTPAKARSQLVFEAQISSGPIPAPTVLSDYEAVLSGSADRIIKMAEQQQLHRHNLESLAFDAARADAIAGRKEAKIGQFSQCSLPW